MKQNQSLERSDETERKQESACQAYLSMFSNPIKSQKSPVAEEPEVKCKSFSSTSPSENQPIRGTHVTLSTSSPEPSITDLFTDWCHEHDKTYSSEQEKQYRFNVFEQNHAFVSHHNNGDRVNSSYSLSLNPFADSTLHEFKASRLGLSVSASAASGNADLIREVVRDLDNVVVGNIPAAVDWRKNGAVTHVKDQGSCGTCWSFSATGAMEGINKISTGSLVSLSEQELVYCDKSYNSGCGGGLMDYAYQFVIDNKRIGTEEDYPCQTRERTCNKEKLARHVVTIDGYYDVPPKNEKQLLQDVATQPINVGICGGGRSFQLYSKGIFTGPCSTSLDHAVLIAGHGSENGVDYWILKNSRGTPWGRDGYMHMQRNSGSSQGVCEINMIASYPNERDATTEGDSLSGKRVFSCATCGIVIYARTAIVQPSEVAARYLMSADNSLFNDTTIGSGVSNEGVPVAKRIGISGRRMESNPDDTEAHEGSTTLGQILVLYGMKHLAIIMILLLRSTMTGLPICIMTLIKQQFPS